VYVVAYRLLDSIVRFSRRDRVKELEIPAKRHL
jgi:hypothetical protein